MGRLFFVFILIILSSCQTYTLAPNLITPASRQIDTAIVTRGNIADITRFEGVTRIGSIGLSFGSNTGGFGELYVYEGQEVFEGDLLAILDTTHIEELIYETENRINRLQQERRLIINEMTARLAIDDTLRNRAEIDIRSLHFELSLKHANEDLDILHERLTAAKIYAPFNGIITYIPSRQRGDWVHAFEHIIFISNNNTVFVEYIGASPLRVSNASRIEGHIAGEVYELFLTDSPIRFMGEGLPLGRYVSIHVYNQFASNALRIPTNAIFYDSYVYIIKDNRLVLTPVILGIQTETFTVILEGLNEGDEVYVRP